MIEPEFQKLFSENSRAIFNYLYFLCGDEKLAEDLTQDTFLKVWEKRGNINSSTVQGLLYRIAKNLFLDHKKHQRVKFRFWRSKPKSVNKENPEFILEEKEFHEKLINQISSLSPKMREVFLMNRIEKLTYREIAEKLQISQKAVEKRMSAALKIMHEIHKKI